MAWGVAAVAGATLLGAYMNSQAAGDAADTEAQAAEDANRMQLQMYSQTRADLEPYAQAGLEPLSSLASGDFMNNWQDQDPGYQFRLNEGMKAIQNSAAAKGNLNSGATLKALQNYGQDYASNEYNNAYARQYNRLSSLANMGQNSAAMTGQAGQAYANAYGNNVTGAANARAASDMANANNMTNLINTGANTWMGYNMMNRLMPQNPPNTSSPY